jgi:branched-chain amino acid transport system substrate-binding protein
MSSLVKSFRRLATAAMLAGAFSLHSNGASAEDTFRFGLAMPLSGSQALYGSDQVKAAEWAVEKINAEGGINGKKLEVVALDTQGDPQLGIKAVNRLTSVDKVPAIVIAWSAVVKATAPIMNDSSTLALSVGANSADVAKLGDYVYTTYPLADVDITAVAKYSVEKLGKKKAAVVFINNESGIVAAKVYKDAFTKAGGEVVAYEAYDPKASDWTGPLLKVRTANPDIIHVQGVVGDIPQVVAQMRQLGLNQTVTSYSAIYNPKFIEQLGTGAEGVIATSLAPGADENAAVADYLERWQKEVGRPPNGLPYTQYLYDAPYVLAAIFKSLDDKKLPITGENMRKEMLAIKTFDLPLTGKLVVNENHTVSKPVILMQVKDGAWTKLAVVD